MKQLGLPNASRGYLAPHVEELCAHIHRKWKPGDRIAPDKELAEQVGLKASKLREAMNLLEQLGVVERRRRSGTFLKQQVTLPVFAKQLQSCAAAALNVLSGE